MNKIVKKLFVILIVSSIMLSMSACQKKEVSNGDGKTPDKENKVKISYALWDENQLPVYEKIVEEFEKENKGIEVELQLTPWSQYWTKLDAALGGDNAADVFWMNTFLPKYADANMVEPLDDYIKKYGIDMGEYVPAMVELYQYKGKQYSMPKGMDTVQVFYNNTIFDKYEIPYPNEGWTWSDMITIGGQMRDKIKSANGGEYPLVMELDAQPSYFNFIKQEGGYVISEDGKESGYNKPETAKAYQDVLDLMNDKIMPDFKVLSDTKGTDIFLSQKAAMIFMGSWKASQFDDATFANQIGVIPMPKKSVNNASVIAGLGFAMNYQSKNKEAAWELIKFLAGEESNKMQAEAKIDMPALIKAQKYYVPNFKNLDAAQFFKVAETAYPFPSSPTFAEWFGEVNDVSNEIFSGNISPDEGCKKIYEEMMKHLKE